MLHKPTALAATAFAAAILVSDAAAAKRHVDNPRELRTAIAALKHHGGIIVLRPGRYPPIVVKNARRVTLRGPGSSTKRLRIFRSRGIRVQGLTVRARDRSAELQVFYSQQIRLEGVSVVGLGSEDAKARLTLRRARHVIIRESRFGRCGDRIPCVLLGRSDKVVIASTTFEDCEGCDLVRGRVGVGLTIRDSTFGNAVTGRCWRLYADLNRCNHQDIVQIQGGREILIERNRFGVQEIGAARLYVAGLIDDVTIRNNVFQASTPLRPGWVGPVGIMLGNRVELYGPPTRVVIAHNTILSGAFHSGRQSDSSIVLTPLYADVPVELQPIVVNNVMASARTLDWLCGRTQIMASNVIADGAVCSEADTRADPQVDPEWGFPDPSSPLIDAGSPGWAVFDVNRATRDAVPDIGAYEVSAYNVEAP